MTPEVSASKFTSNLKTVVPATMSVSLQTASCSVGSAIQKLKDGLGAANILTVAQQVSPTSPSARPDVVTHRHTGRYMQTVRSLATAWMAMEVLLPVRHQPRRQRS